MCILELLEGVESSVVVDVKPPSGVQKYLPYFL
jgi:hypothetical protein